MTYQSHAAEGMVTIRHSEWKALNGRMSFGSQATNRHMLVS